MSETDAMSTRCAMAYTADDYDVDAHVPAAAALERLRAGNRIYVEALDHERDLSPERIADLFENGQRPFACVIACADSRVVPEHIFMAGCSLSAWPATSWGPSSWPAWCTLASICTPASCWCSAIPTAAPSRRPLMGKRVLWPP